MTQTIQYLYKSLPGKIEFQLSTINQGFTFCRRLGWTPRFIILGKEECKAVEMFSPVPFIKETDVGMVNTFFNCEVRKSEEQSYLGFECEPWDGGEKFLEEIRKNLK